MEIKVRECTLDDVPAISRLHGAVESLHRTALPARFREPPPEFVAGLVQEALASETIKLFVAESEDGILGHVRVMIKELPQHPLLHQIQFVSVEELSVAPLARRQGVGTRLMAAAEDWAKQKGFAEIELNVWRFNEGAEEFYWELGYQPIRTYYSKRLTET